MNQTRRQSIASIVAGITAGLAPLAVKAQSYPAKPVRLIVPYSPGGPTDTVARIVAEHMSQTLGQPLVVDNKAGGGGNIGTDLGAKSPADGYTLLIGTNNTLAANVSVFKRLPFNPVTDFTGIGMMFFAPSMVSVHPSFPAKNVRELIAALKKNPTGYSYASGGVGASSHFAGALLNVLTGVQMTHIPYKSDALAVNDAIGGQVPIIFSSVTTGMKFASSGRLRPLGVTSAKRVPAFPDIPAIAESGLPAFDISAWFSMMAPAGTPTPVITALNKALNTALRDPKVAGRIYAMGGLTAITSPVEVMTFVKSEIPKWGSLAKAAKISLD